MELIPMLTVNTAYAYWLTEAVILLDIRMPDHFYNAHVARSLLWYDHNWEVLKHFSRQLHMMVLCYHGVSSQRSVYHLLQSGFKHVYNIQGGFAAWNATYPMTICRASTVCPTHSAL